MNHSKAYDRVLAAYGKEKRAELNDKTRTLISQASFDLWHGPVQDDPEWPGFEAACKLIATEIDAAVDSPIYIDTNCECWETKRPSDEYIEDYIEADYNECVRAIVGCKELVEYVTR